MAESENKKSVEEMFKELEGTVTALEQDNVPLDKAFKLYEDGMKLVAACEQEIDMVEKKVMAISEGGAVSEFS